MDTADISTTARSLAETIGALTATLNGEIDGLYTNRNEELARRYSEKARLLADYAAGVTALRTVTGNGQHDLPGDLSALLKSRSQELASAMERNMQSLAIAQEASQRVVDVIIDAVKQQRRTGAAYGKSKDGGLAAPESSGALTQAVTLDERL